MNDKLEARLAALRGFSADAYAVNGPAALATIADAERAMKRIARKAEAVDEWEYIEVVQAKGPTISFVGKLLAENSYETRMGQPLEITLEIFESKGGALIAISSSTLPGGEGREDCRVLVASPSDYQDAQGIRLDIMDFFNWHDRARTMARKLGWNLKVEVE